MMETMVMDLWSSYKTENAILKEDCKLSNITVQTLENLKSLFEMEYSIKIMLQTTLD